MDDTDDTYEVQKGDTLSTIAQSFYGDGSEKVWRRLYEANKRTIGNDPNLIQPGQFLILPPKDLK